MAAAEVSEPDELIEGAPLAAVVSGAAVVADVTAVASGTEVTVVWVEFAAADGGAAAVVVASVTVAATLGSTVTGGGLTGGEPVLCSERLAVACVEAAGAVAAGAAAGLDTAQPSARALLPVDVAMGPLEDESVEVDGSVAAGAAPAPVTGVITSVAAAAGADEFEGMRGGAPTVSSTVGGAGAAFVFVTDAGTVA
jgi:hypothetical protein